MEVKDVRVTIKLSGKVGGPGGITKYDLDLSIPLLPFATVLAAAFPALERHNTVEEIATFMSKGRVK